MTRWTSCSGYLQWLKGDVRLRGGRQELRTGLGFPAFDGAFVSWDAGDLDLDGYAGRSLQRGLREPTNDALRGIEPFLPDASAYLMGGAAHTRFFGTAVTARYHREIHSDRSSLISERASIDVTSVLPNSRVTASLDYDFGFGTIGKSHVTVAVPLGAGRWLLEATARRYMPYFELSTIWGFFQPVEYTEIEMRTNWSGGSTVGLWASAGWRVYGDSEATLVLEPLEDTGWRSNFGVQWSAASNWRLQAEYRLEFGPGGFLSSLDGSARFAPSERFGLTTSLSSFQQIEEFKVGDGRAYGAGIAGDFVLTERTQVAGGVSLLRHRDGGTVFDSPWNQSRGWMSLRVSVGGDPGLRGRGR